MYRIALIDDQTEWREQIAFQIRNSLQHLSIERYQKTNFASARPLLAALERGESFDLVFTDVFLNGDNGIDLARQIRTLSPKTRIVLFSSNRDYVLEGYEVRAIYFFMKPVDEKKLEHVIAKDYYDHHLKQTLLVQAVDGQRVVVNTRSILYFEHYYGHTQVVTTDASYETTELLSQIMDELPQKGFQLCHKSYIVNLDHVRSLERYHFNLSDGSEVPVSKQYFLESREAYERHLIAMTQYH